MSTPLDILIKVVPVVLILTTISSQTRSQKISDVKYIDKAFEGMLKSAEQATMLPSRNGIKGVLEDFYNDKGYYPALHPGEIETDPVIPG